LNGYDIEKCTPSRIQQECRLHPLIYTLLKLILALDVGVSQEGCIKKRKPLDTLFLQTKRNQKEGVKFQFCS
jgi:hypothetical protein